MAQAILPPAGISASLDDDAFSAIQASISQLEQPPDFAKPIVPVHVNEIDVRDLRFTGDISSDERPGPASLTLKRLAAGFYVPSNVRVGLPPKECRRPPSQVSVRRQRAAQTEIEKPGEKPPAKKRSKPRLEPGWDARVIERILAAARSSRGGRGGVPKSRLLPAIILAAIDTGCSVSVLLRLNKSAFDKKSGVLSVDIASHWRSVVVPLARAVGIEHTDVAKVVKFPLHPLTIAALNELHNAVEAAAQKNDLLLAWPVTYQSLLMRLRDVLFRANVPTDDGRIAKRLRSVTCDAPTLLDEVDPNAACAIRVTGLVFSKRGAVRRQRQEPILIENKLRLTLRAFVENEYIPLRGAGHCALRRVKRSVQRLSIFLAAEVLLDQLDGDLLRRFGEWSGTHRAPHQVAETITTLRRIWRFAYDNGHIAGERPKISRPRSRSPWSQEWVAKTRQPDPETPVVFIENESPRTLLRFLRDLYAPLRMVDCKMSSVEDYAQIIAAFRRFLGCEPTLDQLSDDRIERFTAWCVRSGRQPSTINGYITGLCTLWRYAWKKKLLETLPRDIDKLRVNKRLAEAWTLEEFEKLLESAANEPGSFEGSPAALWWTGLLLCLYDTGLRVTATLTLDATALDVETGWLSVPPEFQKQRAGQAFRLHAQTVAVLARLPRTGRLFPTRWKNPKGPLVRWFNRILERAGLPHGKRDKFHRIRRTTATNVYNAADISAAQQQMGHSSSKLTRDHYIDVRLSTRQFVAADSMPRPDLSNLGACSHASDPAPPPPRGVSTARPAVLPDDEGSLPWLD